jgi:hypothetical protein
MVKFELISSGKALGTLQRGKDGAPVASTHMIQELVDGTRRAYRLTDAEVYDYFANGAFDNGYVRAVTA